MFGKILRVEDTHVILENLKKQIETNILNVHVIFGENDSKIVGEIIRITAEEIEVLLVGEIKGNTFVTGIMKKPSMQSTCRIIFGTELALILGNQDYTKPSTFLIGSSVNYPNFKITASMNDFFANHFAIIGNSGSGKSCSVARILQNIFYFNESLMPTNAHVVMFDVYGEYNKAFAKLNELPNISFKTYTTNADMSTDLVKIPAYFLEADDLAILLNATDKEQIPIIENALKLVYIFTSKDPKIAQYKNDIIAKSLLDILSSGKTATQMRDQIVAVLTKFHTDTLNLDTIISQPGYSRTLKQCLNIDSQGKMNAVGFVVDFLGQYTNIELDNIEIRPDTVYSLDDLYYAFEFALINEGIFSSSAVYDKANLLKVRLHSIIHSDEAKYFDVTEYVGREEFVRNFFRMPDGTTAQIINMNFNNIDDRFAKVLTKLFAKLFFHFATTLEQRASFPIHIILEEAHRYVQNDNDTALIGYNIFDRITKEGRKYGVILGFITQRPSELSTTALSQCSNFLVLRMFHPDDLHIVSNISSNLTPNDIEKLKTLRPGMALVFGSAFPMPLLVSMDMPNPTPESSSVNISNIWYEM